MKSVVADLSAYDGKVTSLSGGPLRALSSTRFMSGVSPPIPAAQWIAALPALMPGW